MIHHGGRAGTEGRAIGIDLQRGHEDMRRNAEDGKSV